MSEDRSRRLEYLELAQLSFDPKNPRLPQGRSTERNAVLRYMLESANLTDLMRSIATQDFFPGEPLLVTDAGDGSYVVVEGNRRYAACWLLSHPNDAPTRRRSVETIAEEADFRPTVLPCLVLPASEILGFLGYRHITGIQEWSPLAKARYLLTLWNDDDGPDGYNGRLQWIARRIGSRGDYVARLLTALALFNAIDSEGYFGIDNLDEESLSFSLLALAMNRPTIASYIGLASGQEFELGGLEVHRLEQLVRWFFETDETGRTVLGESRNVSLLVAVLEHDEARAALERGAPLARAFRLTTSSAATLTENLSQALELLDAALALLAGDTAASAEDAQILNALVDRVHEVAEAAGTR